jgi:Bifunctional DNA primase/polymerase, N-terminal
MYLNPDGRQSAALLTGATEYTKHRWKVFPLRGKAPAIPRAHARVLVVATCACREGLVEMPNPQRDCKGGCGRHGHGLYDATDDVLTVTDWWSGPYQGCNIGARIPESMLMIDIDPRHGGDQSWADLTAQYGPFTDCLTTNSGRGDGGRHLYVRRPPGRLTARRLGPGVDLKTSSGYAVMPPSIHPDTGKPYVRVDGPVPAPPEWFMDLVTERPSKPRHKRATGSLFSSRAPVDELSAGFSWAGVLEPHGWECLDLDPDEDGSRWLHPAATSSCSATIRHGCLFVYSTNTPFEVTEPGSPKGYTKFRAYAVLNHEGDRSAAARALGKRVAR